MSFMDSSGPRPKIPGLQNSFEQSIRFHRWATSLQQALTPELIARTWGVSRATSYRWRQAYLAALGKVEAA